MSDPVTALGGMRFDGFVSVAECPPQGMLTLRGDLGSATLAQAVEQATGAAMPGQREVRFAGDRAVAWMAPDELLLLVPYDAADATVAELQAALEGEHALAVRVSDARAMFRLTGADLREVLAKLAPVDMSRGAFTPGTIRRTRLAQVAAAFWMRDEQTADLICFRSVAAYVFGLLSEAARPGSEVDAQL